MVLCFWIYIDVLKAIYCLNNYTSFLMFPISVNKLSPAIHSVRWIDYDPIILFSEEVDSPMSTKRQNTCLII